jgi:CCR4-NOT transcription complex subunit 1 HEAT repeat
MVLDSVPFSFSIRLASVAAPKEQIILEKWLAENLEKHKEAFCEVALLILYFQLSSLNFLFSFSNPYSPFSLLI